jgi:hypothetical protein
MKTSAPAPSTDAIAIRPKVNVVEPNTGAATRVAGAVPLKHSIPSVPQTTGIVGSRRTVGATRASVGQQRSAHDSDR